MYFNLKSHNFKANSESLYEIVAFCNRLHSIHSIRSADASESLHNCNNYLPKLAPLAINSKYDCTYNLSITRKLTHNVLN